MKKVYYEKIGRRYVPVAEYDSTLMDSFPKGAHLVMSYPGGTSRRFNIDPAHAPLIAAARVAKYKMCSAVQRASESRPTQTPITEEQRDAWIKLQEAFGDSLASLTTSSANDIAEAGINALIEESEQLLKHPTVRRAYEKFLTVVDLVKDSEYN